MKQYFIGFFTGACLITSAVMFMGAGHTHDAYEIYGLNYAENGHSHDAYEIYGIENHSHYEYADSYHTHY